MMSGWLLCVVVVTLLMAVFAVSVLAGTASKLWWVGLSVLIAVVTLLVVPKCRFETAYIARRKSVRSLLLILLKVPVLRPAGLMPAVMFLSTAGRGRRV